MTSALLLALLSLHSHVALQAHEPEPGFVSLFDGRTLDGWVTRGGRYDGNAAWTVEEGCIVGRQGPDGAGGLLYTAQPYTSFELRLEVQLDHPFDSGVFLRMVPPSATAPDGASDLKGAQVTLDWRDGGEIGAVYADGYLQHNPEGAARFKPDAWNALTIRCTDFDMHIEVWLDGLPLCDYQLPPGSAGYAPGGRIGIQVHGAREDEGAARFRNLRLRELPVFDSALFRPAPAAAGGEQASRGLLALSPRASELGWKPLFDGSSLAGWEKSSPELGCRAQDGVLSFLTQGPGGELRSSEDFRDFRLRLEYRHGRMANSGLFLRAARDGSNPAFSGCELQILDDFNWETVTGTKLKPWQFTGSLYGSVPAGDHHRLRPLGEWNTYEVLYQGGRLALALNGRTLYDVDTLKLVPESGEPFARRAAEGFIGLQHHGSENVESETLIEFRNLFVQRL